MTETAFRFDYELDIASDDGEKSQRLLHKLFSEVPQKTKKNLLTKKILKASDAVENRG